MIAVILMKRVSKLIFILILLALLISGVFLLKHKSSSPKRGITVVTSFYPLYDFVKQIGGDKVQVTNITPAGSEPHDFEPTPSQLVQSLNADVFIYNGTSLEPWVDKFVPDFHHTLVATNKNIPLITSNEGASKASTDPHFWLDPTLASTMVDTITAGISQADPANAGYYQTRATSYKKQLADLDSDFRSGLASCQARTVITSHDAFGYFARQYKLKIAPIAGISPDEEPSAARLAELSKLIARENVQYVFFESLVSPKLATTLAQETDIKTAVFDPIEGVSDEAQKQGKDYLTIQHDNLASLRLALTCQ